jgi:hypothetical protein
MVPVPGVDEPAASGPRGWPRGTPWPRWADAATIAVAFLALAVWTWGAWPDVLMDFGRELYVAWRVAEGDILYRDVVSFYGPLSPHLNALWFHLFGVGLRTLALCNMAILGLTVAALWAVLRRGAAQGRWAPTVGALALLALCGFAQLNSMASFNFVAPYSHEATHGFALAVGALLSSLRLLETRRARWAATVGVLLGLSFLTKPEGFVAGLGAAALVTWLALVGPGARPSRSRTWALFTAGMVAGPAAAYALLVMRLPAPEAAVALLGSWAYAANEDLRGLPYFAWSMGTGDVAESVRALLRTAALQAAVFLPVAGLAWLAGRRPHLKRALALVAAVAVFAALAPYWRAPVWLGLARALPLWAAIAVGVSVWTLRRQRLDEGAYARHAARLALATFALLMLPRILLHSRLYHYGFVLAAPALLVVVAALMDWIPDALDRRGASGAVFRAAALAALAVVMAAHLSATQEWLRGKGAVVGSGADRFRSDVRGAYVSAALQGIARMARPSDTLVVLPEGVMVNYLLRMRSSVPYPTMLPTDVAQFGEAELLGALQREPPSLILLVHRETVEYGARFFGRDYGARIFEWIGRRYVRVGGAGDPPFQPGTKFGVAALRRREDVRAEPAPGEADNP